MGLVVERNFVWCLVGHSWHIYGICKSRSKKVWGMLKSHHLEVAMQVTESGTLFIGKAGCHYVILLYCETLLQVLLGIYHKRFCRIPLFTMLLLFYVFEVGKAKSAYQSVLKILTGNGLEKNLGSYFTLENSRQNKALPLETLHNCVVPFRNFKANQDPWKFHVIFSLSRPENSTLFLSHKNTFIAIENIYLSEWSCFEI